MRTLTITAVAAACVAAAGPAAADNACPEFMRGARLGVAQVDDGVAFRITAARTHHVPYVRQLLRELAGIVEQHARESAAEPNPAAIAIPLIDVDVEDVTAGVLVIVRALHTEDVSLLRLQARGLEKFWETSPCINGQPQTVRI